MLSDNRESFGSARLLGFVRTPPSHQRAAELIQGCFHDAARILDLTDADAVAK
jgi:hypothetical protein